MSITLMNRYKQMSEAEELPPLSDKERLTLIALADYANESSETAWPSVAQLATFAAANETTVRRALRRLEGCGLISKLSAGHGGRGLSTTYAVLPKPGHHYAPVSATAKGGTIVPGFAGKRTRKTRASSRLNPGAAMPVNPGAAMPPQQEKQDIKQQDPTSVGADAAAPRRRAATGGRKQAQKPRRATTLPASWAPNADHEELAATESVDVQREAVAFRDHAQATGRAMKDWDACFRMWLRKAKEFGSRNGYSRKVGLTLQKQKYTPTPDDADIGPRR